VINVGDWGSFDRAANEINLISFNVFDNHNLFLGKEMKGQVASSFSQNTLLEQENIGT
jgi:hypothetical protein